MRMLRLTFIGLLFAASACATSGASAPLTEDPDASQTLPAANADGGATCGAGKQDCNGACTDTATDVANCGSCGFACKPGETCSSAGCKGPDGRPTCAPDRKLCGDTCVNTATDRSNCGDCGIGCGVGEICQASKCEPEPSGCPNPEETKCAAGCADTRTDTNNCGVCGNVCAGTCADKKCTLPPPVTCTALETRCEVCAPGQLVCPTACFDVNTSAKNCGFCGVVCSSDKVCKDKHCVTP